MTKLTILQWAAFLALNIVVISAFCYALLSPASGVKTGLLPGITTHGHYQIEMDCNACHTPGLGIEQESCLQCHEQELKDARDTHPASKFNDPTNATRLQVLDAKKCTTCHREHVEDQTLAMGLTLPKDYCYHCHQETLETRPSHANLPFDSCATAGCHNYHDNRTLYENFLVKHYNEPDHLDSQLNPLRQIALAKESVALAPDHPEELSIEPGKLATIIRDWSETAHADVNCSQCHGESNEITGSTNEWVNEVDIGKCSECHGSEYESFIASRHGMRLSRNLPPMTVAEARIDMHVDATHRSLDCMSCHQDHRFDTQFAAVDACLQCHSDDHSLAYKASNHYALFVEESNGQAATGSGVSCATCHLPRIEGPKGKVTVQHNQNNNLRPNEKMIREVCMNCHGLQYSLNSMIDSDLIADCFNASPTQSSDSLQMAKEWFDAKEQAKQERLRKRAGN